MSRFACFGATALTVTLLTLFSAAVQADARIAFVGRWGGPLTIVGDDGVSGRRVVSPFVTGFELAPRGDAVVYLDPEGVAWLEVFGRGAGRLPKGSMEGGMAWSPDGRALAFARRAQRGGAELLVIDRASGRELLRVPMGRHREPEGVAWRPDGRRLAFVRTGVPGRTGPRPSQIVTLDLAGGGRRRVYTAGRDHPLAASPVWTRGGIALMVGAPDLSSPQADGDDMRLALVDGPGQPRYLGTEEGAPRSVTSDGRRFMLNPSCVFDLREGDCAIRSKLPGIAIQDVSPEGGRALVLYEGRLQVLRLEANALPYSLGIEGPVATAQWRAG